MSKPPNPYPSAPGRPPAFNLYLSRHGDDDTQMAVVGFCEVYAGKKFMDELLLEDGWIWETDFRIRSETGIIARCSVGRDDREASKVMRAIMEHRLSPAEIGFEFSGSWAGIATNFRVKRQPRTAEERAARLPRAPSAPRASAPHGSIHVSVIAEQMGIEPRVARGALRGLMAKPSWGWSFPAAEVEDVKAKIKEAIS